MTSNPAHNVTPWVLADRASAAAAAHGGVGEEHVECIKTSLASAGAECCLDELISKVTFTTEPLGYAVKVKFRKGHRKFEIGFHVTVEKHTDG